MNLLWGVTPLRCPAKLSASRMAEFAEQELWKRLGALSSGDVFWPYCGHDRDLGSDQFRIIGLGKICPQVLPSKRLTCKLRILLTYNRRWREGGPVLKPIDGGKCEMLTIHHAGQLPPSIHPQNIENKEAEKILPRKILHPKELDIKILHPKDLRAKNPASTGRDAFLALVTLGELLRRGRALARGWGPVGTSASLIG